MWWPTVAGSANRGSMADLTAPTRPERAAVTAITIAFLAICAFWAVVTPIYQVPDEHAHLSSAIRLTDDPQWPAPGEARLYPEVLGAREEAALPADERSSFAELRRVSEQSGVDQMTQHPPLYYAFGAAVLRAIGYDEMRADHALLSLRLAGLLFAAPLPLLVWSSARQLTGSPRAGVVGAAALLAVPQLAQVLGGVSNDGLIILLCSIVIWLAIRVMTGDARRRTLAGLGVCLGLALLTKGMALPFVVFTAVVLMFAPRGVPMAPRLLRTFATLALAFVIGGWWWLRNLVVYGDLQPSGLAGIRPTQPWEAGTGPDFVQYLDLFWSRMSVRFWGEFGLLEHSLPEVITDVLSVLTLAVIVGFGFARHPRRPHVIVLSLLPVILMVMLVGNTWRHFVRTQLPAGMQGRYLYVAIVALIAVSAIAWMRCIPARHHRRAGVAIVVVATFLAILGPFRQYIGGYENSLYRITAAGVRQWLTLTPAGTAGVVVVSVLAAAAGIVALVTTIRYLRYDHRPQHRAAVAD